MNRVSLIGRLTRDADVRYSGEKSTCIARFTLAVDRRFKSENDEQTADFISCVAFGKTAEWVEKYTHQGMKIAIGGRIQTGSYTNKDGQKVYTTDVVIEQSEFVESKAASANAAAAAPAAPVANGGGFMNIPDGIDDEELPFN